ncbi:MAG: hypothetical protein Kow0065_21770 [Methylomicrobium sp.]
MLDSLSRPTILIVDDEPVNIQLLAGILNRDYHIKVAGDGKTAIDIARTTANLDLILLDVMMPGIDGFEVCRELKSHQETRGIPVIFITAANNPLAEIQGLTLGAVDYITKPIDTAITKQRIQNQIALRQAQDKLRQHDALLNTMIENAPTSIKVISNNGELVLINKIGLDMLGVDNVEQVRESGLLSFVDEPFHDAFQRLVENTLRGMSDSLEFSITSRRGAKRWLRSKTTPLYGANDELIGMLGMTTDITASRKADEQLRLSARVFDSAQEGILVTDLNGTIVNINEAFTLITGYTPQDVLGKTPAVLQSGEHDAAFYEAMWDSIRTRGQWQGEIWNRKKDGGLYPEWLTISSIVDEAGHVTHYVGIFSDHTLIKQHEKELERIAHFDMLTGIPNRFLLDDRLQRAIAHAKREKTLLAVCYLDLDSFKPINDNLGHEAGDAVLIETARRLKHTVRDIDTVARLGGDEFVILLSGLTNTDECIVTLERMLDAITRPITVQDTPCKISASIGVTIYPEDNGEADTLLRHADQAMYVAKQSGKNRYYFYNAEQEQRLRSLSEMLQQIERGLIQREFELFYQPKVEIHSGRVIGAEALIRWRHPERGLLTPIDFLPLVEHSELEIVMGDWVIDCALEQHHQWRQQGLMLELSINISANHLQAADFVGKLTRKLAGYPNLPKGTLQIEILETAALEDFGKVIKIIEACRRLGISFALDDFGTGYSSLTYLRNLPAKTIKIDQSFVRDMLADQGDQAIVEGIIALAKTFARQTVAEGVETLAHLRTLRAMGCEIGQGYGIARPMTATDFASWYRQNHSVPVPNDPAPKRRDNER